MLIPSLPAEVELSLASGLPPWADPESANQPDVAGAQSQANDGAMDTIDMENRQSWQDTSATQDEFPFARSLDQLPPSDRDDAQPFSGHIDLDDFTSFAGMPSFVISDVKDPETTLKGSADWAEGFGKEEPVSLNREVEFERDMKLVRGI